MNDHRLQLLIALAASALLLGVLAFSVYSLLDTREAVRTLEGAKAAADGYIEELEGRLAHSETEAAELAALLRAERAKTGSFEERIADISGTVGTLAKLAATDSELLAKYSKVYFLNENYVPSRLALIDQELRADPSRPLEFHADALPALEQLMEEAREDGIELRVASSYRSFGTQAALKSRYVVSYGAGANRFSADQGYSEHQLGTTVDFTTLALGSDFTSFGATEGFAWLTENAHRYGFILSYPEDNAHYQYEPWHWRYVGESLARELHRSERTFYELDQREIDEYLVSLFD